MKRIYFMLGMLLPLLHVFGQLSPDPKILSIGDEVPDIAYTTTFNHSAPIASLAQFKGKVMLLDFWATWCSACIKKLPSLNSWQKKYSADLQVLLVSAVNTGDTKAKVQKLFSHIKDASGNALQLPVMLYDTITKQLFPHKLLSHYIWLSKEQKVIGITSGDEVTEENLLAVISGKIPAFKLKQDIMDFNFYKPLFQNNNGGNGAGTLFRSLLSGYIPGLPSGSTITKDTNNNISRIGITNTPLIYLLMQAYKINANNNVIRLAVNDDTKKYFFDWTQNENIENTFCYELITPPVPRDKAYHYMKQDLERYFNVTAAIDSMLTPSYVLTADTLLLKKLISKGGGSVNNLFTPSNRFMRNTPIINLVDCLNRSLDKPVTDETNFTLKIDLFLGGADLKDIPALRKMLGRYGLRLNEEPRMQEIFTISNKQHLP